MRHSVAVLPSFPLVLAGALTVVALGSCADGDSDASPPTSQERASEYSGTVVAEFPPDAVTNAGNDGATPRWFVTVDLGGRPVGGSDVVTIAFNPADAACTTGESLELNDFVEGTEVNFVRVGNSTDDMSPPIISATDVHVEC